MKLLTIVLFTLALCSTQAKFNLRTYAQQKLKADGTAGNHVIHSNTDIDDIVEEAVNQCFDGQLGKNNAVISNTRSVSGFDTAAAIDGINLCLQNKNLRLGHKIDANLTSSMDDVKTAAVKLNRANDEYNLLIEKVAPGLSKSMGTIESAVESAENELKTAYKESDGESLEDFLSNKQAEYDHVLTTLKAKFKEFNNATTVDIVALAEKIGFVKTNETAFSDSKDDLSSNVGSVVSLIKAHYKEVVDGDSGTVNPVSGTAGDGCGKLTSTTSLVDEESVSSMCGNSLSCVQRTAANVNALSKSQQRNLVYSGRFICVSALAGSTAIPANAPVTTQVECSGATEAKTDESASSTCNLYLLG